MTNFLFINFVLFLLVTVHLVKCANILALMGVGSPSHHLWNGVLINALAVRGHNMTVLTVDVPKQSERISSKVHYIHLEETYNTRAKLVNFDKLIAASRLQDIPNFYQLGHITCQGIFRSKGLKTLLNYSNKTHFDLILYEYSSGPCLLGFLHKFNYPPLVGITAFHNPPSTIDLIGSHHYPAYIPFFSMAYDIDMNFWERLHNTIVYAADTMYRSYVYTPSLDKIVRPFFPKEMPYLGELDKRAALVLVNSHPAVNYPEPLPPNVIEVGGMQLVEPRPLPVDLEQFINKSRKGAILFSLGTNMQSKNLGQGRCEIILNAMTQLPEYNFLWKFDTNFAGLPIKLPKNVLIRPFFPQRDILGHKKIKAFVTHAGGLSIQEATWYGVPLIGIALFIDQKRNLHKSVKLGVAEMIEYNKLTTEILRHTIKKVAEDSRYSDNMKLRSKRFRDRPMSALDTAIWWIEYVLRHPEPDHLRSPVLDLGFWRANSLDVYFGLIAILVIFVCVSYKIFQYFTMKSKLSKKLDNIAKKDN